MELPAKAENTGSSTNLYSPAASASQQLRPRPQTPSKSGSSSLEKEKVPANSSESWETAYVFAFIHKFTSLCHDLKIGLKLRAAQDFERILEVDTRTAPSELTDEPGPDSSEAREILTTILNTFHENLKTANGSTWARWLKSYIEDLVKHELQQPMFTILKWKENYIRTRENGFWDLDWHEKVHLLRILVDHQLAYSAKIKSIIDENHDKATGKSTKQPANLPTKLDAKPSQNPLLIKPLGVDRHSRIWWQIDDSPRIYASGNPYKSENYWEVLSTTKSEYLELSNTLDVNPSLSLQSSDVSQITSDAKSTKQSSTKNAKIPSMFTSNRKKNTPQDQRLKSEWELSQTLAEVAQANIEAGEQRIQQLLNEAKRLEELEAKKQRRIALANAPKRAPDLTRSTPGFGVRSRLRSQLTKPDYVVDSDAIDRKLERALKQYENSSTTESDSGKKAKQTKRKRKGGPKDSQGSDSEDSEYQTGQDASVAGTNEYSETTEKDGTAQASRPSRKRTCSSKKLSIPGERRSLRVRTKIEVEAEEEEHPKPLVTEEESQHIEPTWSRSKPPVSSSNSEIIEGPIADSGEPNDNVSVWSRGKLIYVAGNNKYACKPGVASEAQSATTSTTRSLSVLQARLEAMAGDDDDDDDNDNTVRRGQIQDEVLTNRQAGEELDAQHVPSLLNLFGTDLRSDSNQVDGDKTKSTPEEPDDGKASVPSPIIELLHEQPTQIESDQDKTTHSQINNASSTGLIQHINTPALSTNV
ncbi:hypothetical protein PCANC_18827 [Puccinia coronata f. sp. avenae]|uniref:WHIM1 domain-containing protein n=1 Tax=Puccinia coronata f. sp. avenae TaxID=200324 RepID=A0A2N5U500_9BASI|nr:hypothetical protein PCANC_18827 [Puccinia coronata f. sp. avenae]